MDKNKAYRKPTLVKNMKTGKYYLFKTKDMINLSAIVPPELAGLYKSAAAHHGIAVAELLWFLLAGIAHEGGLYHLNVEELRMNTLHNLGLEICELEEAGV
tara:strand:- start:389 stop:691 length:303 start_codon:yes stop_codon:yes gene_type:complete